MVVKFHTFLFENVDLESTQFEPVEKYMLYESFVGYKKTRYNINSPW